MHGALLLKGLIAGTPHKNLRIPTEQLLNLHQQSRVALNGILLLKEHLLTVGLAG